MSPQPGPTHNTPATAAGQRAADAKRRADALAFLSDIEDIMQRDAEATADEQTPRTPTFYKDPTPPPRIGDTPPVQQPGRPAMSQKATNDSVRMLSFGVTAILTSGAIALVMKASEAADPTVMALIAGAPVGLTVPILAAAHLMRRTKEAAAAAPPQVTQHYSGDIYQDNRSNSSSTRGFIATTNTRPPR